MAAYCIFDILKINDAEKVERYRSRVGPVVEKYGGRYLVTGGQIDVLEGDWRPTLPVIIEFPSLEHARRWYASEDYRELKALRLSAVMSNGVIVEGLQ
jgi:uncharacterized protein (DUF1330 family)